MLFSSLRLTRISATIFPLLGALITFPIHATTQQNQITNQLSALEKNANGRLGVVLIDTADHSTITYHAHERFPLCSTSKMMAVSALLKKSETDEGLLNQRIHYQQSDIVEYSPITEKHLQDSMTLAELSAATIQYSDNTAMNLLIDQLGGTHDVTRFARSIGDNAFRLDRKEPELNMVTPVDERDTTTPQAMADSLYKLALGNTLAATQRTQLVEWLKGNTTGGASIRAGVPDNWIVGDKTGRCDYGSTNDIAVIWPDKDKAPLILVTYFTQPNDKDAKAHPDVLAAAARIMTQER
ncbi:Beta-lactamase (Penicillinase) (Contains: Beta-lactamase form I; Beta-lactamase form II) [Xenorhabdus bovienii str. oregonense]|uniref:beta-lactamase n=1 Tax=Xenorhabdus bovienii str. oregonense TaxID=1398202 RepID=A0A077NR36_XENBV|nr:class A beta-lactamase [Xenorhabdus bovienii]CDH04567.1 Beta-lactamase (Penicillinase) (Contains: Beta-lactamase form I; Beta-lactamase form II) [Xenorhabdus bovienii str. oregonense]